MGPGVRPQMQFSGRVGCMRQAEHQCGRRIFWVPWMSCASVCSADPFSDVVPRAAMAAGTRLWGHAHRALRHVARAVHSAEPGSCGAPHVRGCADPKHPSVFPPPLTLAMPQNEIFFLSDLCFRRKPPTNGSVNHSTFMAPPPPPHPQAIPRCWAERSQSGMRSGSCGLFENLTSWPLTVTHRDSGSSVTT